MLEEKETSKSSCWSYQLPYINKSRLRLSDMNQGMCRKLHSASVGRGSWKNISPVWVNRKTVPLALIISIFVLETIYSSLKHPLGCQGLDFVTDDRTGLCWYKFPGSHIKTVVQVQIKTSIQVERLLHHKQSERCIYIKNNLARFIFIFLLSWTLITCLYSCSVRSWIPVTTIHKCLKSSLKKKKGGGGKG